MILAIHNPKGGSGKTTTAVNVATELAQRGRSVLLVDLEADMGASISLGVAPTDKRPSIYDLLLNQRRPGDAVRPVAGVPNLHLVAGSPALAGIAAALRNARQPERRLADAIRPLAASVDDVVIDSPSNFTVLSLSVPAIAQHLVVPIRADYLSLESLAHFLRWYRDRGAGRANLARIVGILLTMVDHRREATREIIDIIRVHNRRGVFRTEIPDDPRASEAPSHGVPLMLYARSRAVRAYRRLTSEVLQRVDRRAK
ncbi:MAG TPA: ParA family protein [Vicinamibacterales bacterium]|jgi:chromosome partitioning protein|nr:ParA family protein [Vicinamibacterales bacterium]